MKSGIFARQRALVPSLAAALLAAFGCRTKPPSTTAAPETRPACEQRYAGFIAFLNALPAETVASPVRVALPESTLGESPGRGALLELDASRAALDGESLSLEETEATLRERFSRAMGQERALYVAASADLEIALLRRYLALAPKATELRLLVQTRTDSALRDSAASAEAVALARELLREQKAERRDELATRGYAEFSRCTALRAAVAASSRSEPALRWRARRAALIEAAPGCDCAEVDTVNLQQIASAEQRAGALGLGYLPISFVRDERCGATMPRRAVGKLVKQVEAFDAEFSGKFRDETLSFEQVLTDERLLNYFCNALPGETLAAQQRHRRTLYFRPSGAAACQAWRFEPLAPGAPMGTWRRSVPAAPPLAFHYWQAAEEIRVFGPVPAEPESKPTDERSWECSQEFRLTGVDAISIQSETGHWFFDEASCASAKPEAQLASGCVSTLAAPAPER